MVLRVVGALILKEASGPYLRHLFLQRRRRCSSSPFYGELRQNGPWMQVDTCDRNCNYHVLDDRSIGIWLKQHRCEGASNGLLQQHDGSNCCSCTPQQQGHLHPLPQIHDHSVSVFQMSKLRKQHEKFDKANYGDTSTLQLHTFDHHDTFMHNSTSLQLSEQGEHQCSPARLWEEKEQAFSAFSSRYTAYLLAENQGDEYALEDKKSGLLLGLCREGHLDRALDVLFCMNRSSSTPVYLFLLSECSKNKAVIHAKKVYAHFDHHNSSFGDLLADFLVLKVNNSSALQSIDVTSFSLPWLSVFAWSAMISALVEAGHMKEALQMMQRMHDDGAEPSSYIFVSLIKACSIIKDLYHGMKLHAVALMKGFAAHLIVGSTLVSMYGKCDAILETETVFNTLCAHDVVSCNAMLTAFVDAGQGDRAFLLYRQMHAEGIHANHGTFVMALQACRCLAEEEEAQLVGERLLKKMSLEIGLALHSAIRREGFVSDAFINNTLVTLYGKIGAIFEAELVFDTLTNPEIISWNAMLSTYIENSQGQKALWLYRMILQEDVDADPLTYVFALQACNIIAEDEQAVIIEGKTIKIRSLRLGQALHLDACMMGFASDVFLGTALIGMYGKCGAIEEAEDVFLCLAERDIVSWNAVLSTYVEQEQGEKALYLFRQMQEDGVGANPQTLVFALQACAILAEMEAAVLVNKGRWSKAMALEIGQSLHRLARRKRFTNSFICNTLVNMYGTSGAIAEAEHVFFALSPADVVSWNVMLSAYVDQGQAVPALQLFGRMHERGMAPNHLTIMFALQACGIFAEKERAVSVEGMLKKVVSLEIGGALHKDALAKGFTSDAFVGNTLLSMYAKCGDVLERDSLFGSLLHRDIVSWNPLLSMCVEKGKAEQALGLYKQLQEEQVVPDDATLIFILQACGMTGSLFICEQVHFSIVSAGYDQNPSVAATLLNAYGSCARVADTQVCFNGLSEGDAVSWNTFIAGHLGEEDIASTVHLYEEMIQTGINPDEVTFTSVLSGFSHFGLVVDGFEYFKYTSQHYVIAPNLRHFGALIDLFGRAGDFKRVQILLERMPREPDLPIALCLLGASRMHGNFELAEWAFSLAVRLRPKQPTAYVLMSNIYANTRPF